MTKSKITILGIGSLIYSDDGIGIHALKPLMEKYQGDNDIELIEGATDGMFLLEYVEDREYLIIIDAINNGVAGGTIMQLNGDEIPTYYGIKMSVHQAGFQEVLWLAKFRERYPKHITMIGMQPTVLEMGLSLSKTNEEQLPRLIEQVINQVEAWRSEVK